MNRDEFLNILEKSLDKLPADEKNDALNYYRELFDDAGIENEDKILQDIGDPVEISRQLLLENGIDPGYKPEFPPEQKNNANNQQNSTGASAPTKTKKTDNTTLIVVIVVLIVTSPVWIGVVTGALGTVIGLIAAVLALVIVFYVLCVVFIAVGATIIISTPPIGLMLLGAGLIMAGIAAIATKPFFKWGIGLMTRFVNWISGLVKKLFNKGGA